MKRMLTPSTVRLGIVCPLANEELNIVSFVNSVLDVCAPLGFRSVQFFGVLDRVSKDQTCELLTELSNSRPEIEVVWSPENRNVVDAYVRGYAEAVRAGCDWILEMDAGFSHQPQDIPRFFETMALGYDCVFGSRFSGGGSHSGGSPKRRLISRGGGALSGLLLGVRLSDLTSGFELFRSDALRAVLKRGIHSRGPFFQTEIKAYCRHLRIAEVPIQYRNGSRAIGFGDLSDSFQGLGRLLRLRWQGKL